MTKSKILKELKKTDLDRIRNGQKLEKTMFIRTSKKISEWMDKEKISPRKLFNYAATIIMEGTLENEGSKHKKHEKKHI